MHGHGYSTYTKMVYSLTGLTNDFNDWKEYIDQYKKAGVSCNTSFREYIEPEDLKRIELAESLIKPLLELDKQYSEIKETLKPLFERKELK